MTIECRETIYGRPTGQPHVVEPGTKAWLYLDFAHRTLVGTAIRVDSPDAISVTTYAGGALLGPVTHEREAINKKDLTSIPSPSFFFRDFVLWRRRHYSWKPDR